MQRLILWRACNYFFKPQKEISSVWFCTRFKCTVIDQIWWVSRYHFLQTSMIVVADSDKRTKLQTFVYYGNFANYKELKFRYLWQWVPHTPTGRVLPKRFFLKGWQAYPTCGTWRVLTVTSVSLVTRVEEKLTIISTSMPMWTTPDRESDSSEPPGCYATSDNTYRKSDKNVAAINRNILVSENFSFYFGKY